MYLNCFLNQGPVNSANKGNKMKKLIILTSLFLATLYLVSGVNAGASSGQAEAVFVVR